MGPDARASIPFLPGQSINPCPGHHFPHTTRFDLVQGQAICDPIHYKRRLGPAQSNIIQCRADSLQSSISSKTQADLHIPLHNTQVTMSKIPDWIALDQHVLRFYGYYSQSVHESQIETYRHIPIVLLYYLQDGTIRISETKEDNNGLRHGDLLARNRVSLADTDLGAAQAAPGQYVGPEHLGTGTDITVFGRVYHLTDADQYTRQFFQGALGPARPRPVDPFHQRQRQGDEAAAAAAGLAAGGGSCHYEPVSAHYESVHGRPQPWQLERSRQFLALDGKVLRFFARWHDRRLVVHFFLADDTVEVLEIIQANSGRDPVPALVKRQRLRKTTPSFGIDQIGENSDHSDCYAARDLQIGRVIRVFGRDVVLESADAFTRAYYRDQFGINLGPDLTAAAAAATTASGAGRAGPRPDQGSSDCTVPEDVDERSVIEAAQIALKARRNRPDPEHRRIAKQAMRFKARQLSNRPEDVAREFVITFFPVDESVSVFENPIRNSGFIAGKFLERSLTYNRDKKRMFKMEDFQIGARVQIHGFVFELIDADSATRQLLQSDQSGSADNGGQRRRTDLREIRAGLRILLNNKNTALRKTFRLFDHDKDGFLSRSEFEQLLTTNGWDLDNKQTQAIFEEFDRDRDGKISFDEFAVEIEGPGH